MTKFKSLVSSVVILSMFVIHLGIGAKFQNATCAAWFPIKYDVSVVEITKIRF